ncbi:MAG: 4Fe-4S binding protein, partial [Hyphomicrobiaceae bacterium]
MNARKPDKTLVCDCQRSIHIDAAELGRALGLEAPLKVHTALCRGEIGAFEAAVAGGGCLQVACTQEAPLFRELAEEPAVGDVSLTFTNIRENAGWSEAGAKATPKIAALLAADAYQVAPTPSLTLTSQGTCLVYGPGEVALDAAKALAGRLSPSVLLTEAGDALPPSTANASIARGRVKGASGHLGAFQVDVDGYAPVLPSSRARLEFAMARDGAKSQCDVILDLSGGKPLFAAGQRRDGYLRADPQDETAVARALLAVTDLVGEFEKPRYIAFNAAICAHARSAKVGCHNCLDHCPVGAISPDGDHVHIDAAICGGCGNCAAVCPTGAASYAYPNRNDLAGRAAALLSTYRAAGGKSATVLLHDEDHGRRMIDASARFGRGLPAHVLPLALHSTLVIGHDTVTQLLALGASQIAILVPDEHPEELSALEQQVELTSALLGPLGYGTDRLHIIRERDPFVIDDRLHDLPVVAETRLHAPVATSSKREAARAALLALHSDAPQRPDRIVLPQGAPYGRIAIRTEGCTLCLACVGACPTGALGDNAERPEVRFTEAASVQCGICKATCPEKVNTLEPRYDFTPAVLSPVTLHTEDPFASISSGKPFGAKSTITRVMERLKNHSMFPHEKQLAIVQMCDNCRVVAMATNSDDPFAKGERPRVRTTDDYLA